MALYPFVHVSALELHTLSRYPGNRQTDRNTNRLPYAFAAHAHRGITNNTAVLAYWKVISNWRWKQPEYQSKTLQEVNHNTTSQESIGETSTATGFCRTLATLH